MGRESGGHFFVRVLFLCFSFLLFKPKKNKKNKQNEIVFTTGVVLLFLAQIEIGGFSTSII